MSKKMLLVGSGVIAIDYAKVLKHMNIPFNVIGRGESSAARFEQETNIPVVRGGLEKWLGSNEHSFTSAIVCTPVDTLSQLTCCLIDKGFDLILVEKPGGLNYREIQKVGNEARRKTAKIYVGYNRRFYSSTLRAKEMIKEDGGVTSFHFEFTEWTQLIKTIGLNKTVLKEWFLANSSHVVDLAFYLGGKPKEIKSFTSGGIEWHPNASIYAGAGVSESGALFTYQANWEAPGRWAVEILTKKHRFIFKPLEKLQIQNIGSVAVEEVSLDNERDLSFKPGLYNQIEAFLGPNTEGLQTIEDQIRSIEYYRKINKLK